jgi:fructuronate reductase
MQLCNQTLNQLPAGVLRPHYDRSKVRAGIVHLGVGAFHRAHQAVMTEAVLASGDLDWGIVGAGLMSPGTRDALQPQDGLYAWSSDGPKRSKLRVVGALVALVGGEADLPQVLASSGGTQYTHCEPDRHRKRLLPRRGQWPTVSFNAPMVAADLANPSQPRTILGLIVQALKQRRAAGVPPFTVLSCDNLPNNGKTAKAAVVAFAEQVDSELASWIKREVRFHAPWLIASHPPPPMPTAPM